LRCSFQKRIQHIFAGPNKDREADHYLVVWEDYPLEKDYSWETIEHLYGHEDLAQTYEQWLKTENERLDSEETERKTSCCPRATNIDDNVRRILCIGAMLDPRFKTIKV
jgi:hypothetical protein